VNIAFAHHLSLSYLGGGEKWIINTAKELVCRGHYVEIFALPFLLEGKRKVNPKELLEDIPYTEGRRHKIKADIVYVMYNPLSWMFFQTSKPRIGGIHAQSYWQKPNFQYGLLPNVSLVANKALGYFELRHFNAVHMVTTAYPCNHPKIYYIPNFVDSEKYRPVADKGPVFTVAYISRKVWQKGWDLFEAATKGFHTKVAGGCVKEKDMPTFISSAHVSLIPSRVDTFGLAIVESLLCCTPVITTPLKSHAVLALPMYFRDNVSGFRTMLGVLEQIWEETPEKYMELTRCMRQQAMKYDKKPVMDRIEGMFKEVLEGCS